MNRVIFTKQINIQEVEAWNGKGVLVPVYPEPWFLIMHDDRTFCITRDETGVNQKRISILVYPFPDKTKAEVCLNKLKPFEKIDTNILETVCNSTDTFALMKNTQNP